MKIHFIILAAAVVTVTVTGNGHPQIAHQNYSLNCTFTGTTSPASGYMWLKNGDHIEGEVTPTLSFSSLRLSDAGLYTCEVNINSALFRGNMSVFLPSMLLTSYVHTKYVPVLQISTLIISSQFQFLSQ